MTNPISRALRPIVEKKKARSAFGGLLSAAGFVLATEIYPAFTAENVLALEPVETKIETKTILSGPDRVVPGMTGVSQGYHPLHPGLGVTAPEGSLIYPIRPGKVVYVRTFSFGYGRHVIVDHGNGIKSLYAHMGKIRVDEGDEVTESTPLGEVGMTGRTTGPHLHLEVRRNSIPMNPVLYLKANSEKKST